MENQLEIKAIIYGLHDPRGGELRYIGKTQNNRISVRLSRHILDSKTCEHHRARWIRSLTKLNLKPELRIIEETPLDAWQERERFWIKYFKEQGADLTNFTDGGDGGATMLGKKFPKERCEAISERLKGHPVSEKARQAFIARCAVKGQTPHNKKLIDEAQLLKLYLDEKQSAEKIGKIFGVSLHTVLRRLKELGLSNEIAKRNHQGTRKLQPNDITKIVELLNQGVSQKKIGLQFNVSQSLITLVNRKHRAASRLITIYIERTR